MWAPACKCPVPHVPIQVYFQQKRRSTPLMVIMGSQPLQAVLTAASSTLGSQSGMQLPVQVWPCPVARTISGHVLVHKVPIHEVLFVESTVDVCGRPLHLVTCILNNMLHLLHGLPAGLHHCLRMTHMAWPHARSIGRRPQGRQHDSMGSKVTSW